MPLKTGKQNSSARWPKLVAIVARTSVAPRWLHVLVGIAISTATLFLWQALIAQDCTSIEQMILTESSNVKNEVAAQLETQTRALVQMANRWEMRGGTPKQEWEADAQLYVSDYGGYQAIEWVDPSFHVRWIVPREGNEAAQNLNLTRESRRRIALETARNRHEVTVTRSINLVQGGNGFQVYVPIFVGEDFRGFIVGVFRVQQLLDTILEGEENVARGYSITVFDGKDEIYSHNVVSRQHEKKWGQETKINFYGVTWRMQICPTPELLAKVQSPLPRAVLIGGLLMAWLLALTVHLIQKTRLQQQQAEGTNLELEREIAERKRSEVALQHVNVDRLRSQEMLQLVMDLIPQSIWWKDRDSRFLGCNRNFAIVAGVGTPENIIGKTDYDVWTKEDADFFRSVDARVMTQNQAEYGIVEPASQRDSGTLVWLETNKIPLHDVRGRVIGTLGTAQDITERKRAEEQIKASLQEKEVLLKEVHHRVKNNLQVIDSLFRHQCRHAKDKQTIEVLKECQNRVNSMAMLHEKLYQSQDLSKINSDEYITSIVANLVDSYSCNADLTSLKINIEDIVLDIETALYCGLIVNELVSNSFKYAFPPGKQGEIHINFYSGDAHNLILSVKDNGVGLPISFDLQKSQSLGLKLVRSFVRQLGGDLEINRSGGTEFMITFTYEKDEIRN